MSAGDDAERSDKEERRIVTAGDDAERSDEEERRIVTAGDDAERSDEEERRIVTAGDVWDVEVRPRLMPYFAYGAAFVIAAVHIVVGLLLKIRSSGVIFQTTDQVAIAGLGLIIAGGVLLFTRPRLRAGAAGLSVRNLFGDRLIPWPQVVGVSFPVGKRWARVDLPADEYIPVMAIQAVDKEHAVNAMEAVRALAAHYRPPPPREQT